MRMNDILPGFVDCLPETKKRQPPIPMGRYGRTEEIRSLIFWLASEQGSYMTAQKLRVAGGLTRGA
ncbi:SDR family oxidoreductase [Pseudophaeobacter arcticus]|uniref:SDR family oxidoreductase n=1 Tax=Pseudophaeobacter arcticus TaxID=385492 RepID=UPI003A97B0CF